MQSATEPVNAPHHHAPKIHASKIIEHLQQQKNTAEIQRASSTVSGNLFHQNVLEEEDESAVLESLMRTWRFSLLKEQKTLKFHHGGRQMLQPHPETDLLLA